MSPDSFARHTWDVVVVGARCAGAATAIDLARAGLRVLVVERSPLGSDTLSTHALMRGGVVQLARLGVLDRVVAAGTPAVPVTTFHYDDEVVPIPIAPKHGVAALRAPRRTVLDPILADAAREAGAELVFGRYVHGVLTDRAGRVTGVSLRDSAGIVTDVRAGLVVGADGLRSVVAQAVRAPIEHSGTRSSATLYRLVPWVPADGYHWHWRPGFGAGVIPTNGGESVVFAAASSEWFRLRRARGLEALYAEMLAGAAPDLAARVRAFAPGVLRAFPGRPGYLRRSSGPGWALVGDAGYFRDPITSHGMTDALRDAAGLARAIACGTEQALRDHQRDRDDDALEIMRLSDEIAGFAWDFTELRALHKRLSRAMSAALEASLARAAVPSPIPVSTSNPTLPDSGDHS